MSAPVVPLMALVLAAFAGNQVEAFAVAKGSGFLFTGPVAAFFIPRPLDLIVGICPRTGRSRPASPPPRCTPGLFWVAAAAALLYPSACVAFLDRRFRMRATAG